MTWFFWQKAEQVIRRLQRWTVKHRVAAARKLYDKGKKA